MIRVFGITGTNGKTTASWMLRNILQQSGECGLIGTIEYVVGEKHYLPQNTTPGRKVMRKLLSEMKERQIQQCVMEVSSHGIHQGRVDEVSFSGIGFTNLSRDHLDYHKTMEEYYQVKKQFFLKNPQNTAVNIDDEYGKRLYSELEHDLKKSCSLQDAKADVYGKILQESLQRTCLEVFESEQLLGQLVVSIPGRQFAEDALLAATMARQAGIDFDQIQEGLKGTDTITGRMERVGKIDDTLGIVDYAHTPDSLERLLKTVCKSKKGKVICVFGCGGYRDKGKRYLMGKIAGTYCDYCIITNDNPRGEPPENIAQAVEEGVHAVECEYSIILNRYQAIKRAVSLADKWDIIVVAGKGHETYQVSGAECVPFNDKEVLRELLEKKYEKIYTETN